MKPECGPRAGGVKRAMVLGGRTGLLGRVLAEALAKAGWEVAAVGRQDFEPGDEAALSAALEVSGATVLFNTVGYTAVDKAEDEPEAADRLNRALPGMLARRCKALGVGLVHYSTDFVFDGKKDAPYTPEDRVNPLSVYGRTKLAGERAILEAGLDDVLIIRTSWLFGPYKTNFVDKILNLALERDVLRVVADQVGSPSYTVDLAKNSVALVEMDGRGVFHLASGGRTSWCGLAAEAVTVAGLTCKVEPIQTADYPTKAARPAFSVLDLEKFRLCTGITPRPWTKALRDYIYGDLKFADRLPH